jgi:hypothetical protein
MRVKAGLLAGGIAALAALGFAVAVVLVDAASAHTDPCHSQHTCPSDHHTYVWTDPTTGLQWDCVEPGAREYNPVVDVMTIMWDGRTYYCRAAGGSTTTTTTTVSTSTTLPTSATGPTVTQTTTTSTTTTTTATTTTVPTPTVVLPIKSITPGAFNVKVRQGTIRRTICKAGWTATVRPKPAYTNALKIKQMPLYELGGSPALYEEDHLIPLELGGAPRNPKNLWPEPRAQAKRSDPLETRLKRQVCRGFMRLATARASIKAFKYRYG